jgi:hypothetical protein
VPYGGTDSFVYNIKHPDIYEWIKETKKHFDLSDYKREDMQDDTNKKKLGCFKDELNGMVMSEFIGLNPKSYAFKYQNIEKNKAKGVSKAVVDKLITFNDYKNTLDTNKPASREVISIRSFNQQLFTYKLDKIALTSFYDKMKMIDSINCEPYGYIKYEHDDTNNIINEVKDVKTNTSIDDNDNIDFINEVKSNTSIYDNDNIDFIDEVEDVKHNTNIDKVKLTKDLTLNIPKI